MYMEQFPSRLKEARKKAEMTQQEVTNETGINRSALSKYENGKIQPDIETLGKLAELYKVSTDWLYGIGKK